MSFEETVLLGGLAGLTIFLSLPFGRLQMLSDRARVGLAMFAVGVLAFLFADVFEHALHIAEEAVEGYEAGEGSLGKAIGFPRCWPAASRWAAPVWRFSSVASAGPPTCPRWPAGLPTR